MKSSTEKYITFEKGLLAADESFDVENVLNNINYIEILSSMSKDSRLSLYQEHLTESESASFDDFYNNAFGESLTFGAVESIINNGEISIKHPLNDDILRSRHSIQIGFKNFVRFQSSNDVLYIYQDNFTYEAFFFPFRELCIVIKHNSFNIKKILPRLLSKLKSHARLYRNYFFSTPSFGGIKIEHPSPYHWYYLKMQALSEVLPRFAEKKKKVDVISSSKGMFLRLDSIFPDVIECTRYVEDFIRFDGKLIPSECFYNEFYFSIGFRWCPISSPKAEMIIKNKITPLDDSVLQSLKTFDSCTYNEVLCAHENGHFILWLGITTGKRAWLEEMDAYAELVKRLSAIHKKVAVIFDGWTGRYQKNKDLKQAEELYSDDEKVKDRIINKLQRLENVNFISLIGSLAGEKIAIANKVDFFVANHATGSLWVSRIARNTGVVHISNAARKSSIAQHIHWDALLIDADKVHDIEPDKQPTPFDVSYSISVDTFLTECFSKLYQKSLAPITLKSASSDQDSAISPGSLKYFDVLANRLEPVHKSPDFYRELALAFEELGDIKNAFVLMNKAYALRPTGPFIKRKVEEYQLILKEGNNDR